MCLIMISIWCILYNFFLCRFQARDSDSESVTSTELFIEGIAISSKGEGGKKSNTPIFFVMNAPE